MQPKPGKKESGLRPARACLARCLSGRRTSPDTGLCELCRSAIVGSLMPETLLWLVGFRSCPAPVHMHVRRLRHQLEGFQRCWSCQVLQFVHILPKCIPRSKHGMAVRSFGGGASVSSSKSKRRAFSSILLPSCTTSHRGRRARWGLERFSLFGMCWKPFCIHLGWTDSANSSTTLCSRWPQCSAHCHFPRI